MRHRDKWYFTEDKAATLVRFANNAGGLDNITVALIDWGGIRSFRSARYLPDDIGIIKEIGQRRMADVYLAKDLTYGEEVAVKVLRTTTRRIQSLLHRFQREAQRGRLRSSSYRSNFIDIVKKTVNILAMEWCSWAWTLKRYIKEHYPLSTRKLFVS